MSKHFPAQPSLRQLKSQAKDLKKACDSGGDPQSLQRFRQYHPQHAHSSDADIVGAGLSLQDAQLVLAREYGFDSWPKLSAAIGNGPRRSPAAEAIIGSGEAAQRIRSELVRAATTDVPLLLVGESGVGKRWAARCVHSMSRRSEGPFVQCDATAGVMADSELFGHEPGAFTGANSARAGSLETAAGGTLVIEEIGSLSMSAQGTLQSLIENGTFRHLGGTQDLSTDARLVCTNSKDLQGMVEAGAFREDLYYRMEVLRIDLPPLRDRAEDIPELVRHFAAAAHQGDGSVPEFGEEAIALLTAHSWPGNVRELRHTVERAVVGSVGDTIPADGILLRAVK
jgi:DNA-binding NtrC family response regulator